MHYVYGYKGPKNWTLGVCKSQTLKDKAVFKIYYSLHLKKKQTITDGIYSYHEHQTSTKIIKFHNYLCQGLWSQKGNVYIEDVKFMTPWPVEQGVIHKVIPRSFSICNTVGMVGRVYRISMFSGGKLIFSKKISFSAKCKLEPSKFSFQNNFYDAGIILLNQQIIGVFRRISILPLSCLEFWKYWRKHLVETFMGNIYTNIRKILTMQAQPMWAYTAHTYIMEILYFWTSIKLTGR